MRTAWKTGADFKTLVWVEEEGQQISPHFSTIAEADAWRQGVEWSRVRQTSLLWRVVNSLELLAELLFEVEGLVPWPHSLRVQGTRNGMLKGLIEAVREAARGGAK